MIKYAVVGSKGGTGGYGEVCGVFGRALGAITTKSTTPPFIPISSTHLEGTLRSIMSTNSLVDMSSSSQTTCTGTCTSPQESDQEND